MNTTFESIVKAIGEAVIAFFKSDMPEKCISYFDSVSEGMVNLIRNIIETFAK